MKESILKRYPTLKENDVVLRNDGNGIFIDVWKGKDPKPTMAQVNQWVAEDANEPKQKTEVELLQAENEDLKRQTAQLNADLAAFMDYVFGGDA